MEGDELREAFERLGEAEVVARVAADTWDAYTRAFAVRWLGDRALERVMAEQKARGAREAAATWGRRARRLMIAAALTICVLAAMVVWQSRLRAAFSHGEARVRAVLDHASATPGLK